MLDLLYAVILISVMLTCVGAAYYLISSFAALVAIAIILIVIFGMLWLGARR